MSTVSTRVDRAQVHPLENLSSYITGLADRIAALESKLNEAPVSADMHTPIGVSEASQFLRLSTSRVYMLCHEGKLPCHRRGGRLYFFKPELIDLIRSGASKVSRNKKAVAL